MASAISTTWLPTNYLIMSLAPVTLKSTTWFTTTACKKALFKRSTTQTMYKVAVYLVKNGYLLSINLS